MIIAPTKKTRPVGFPEKMDGHDFVGHMAQHFRVYHKDGSPEEAQWTDNLVAILSNYATDVLADCCLWFMQHRKEIRFPLPAEIITVCDEIAKERARPTLLAKEAQESRQTPHSRERMDLVRHLLGAGHMGKQAEREGWIGALGDYVRHNARLPDPAEIPRLKRTSTETTEMILAVYRGEVGVGGGLLEALRKFAGSVEQRRREYAAMVTGEVA